MLSKEIAESANAGKRVELLLGTRGFVVPASRNGSIKFVAIYGSEWILASCRREHVRIRLVTTEDALRNPDGDVPATRRSSALSMTYSETKHPNLEDESIPLLLVDVVTTERRSYTREQVKAILKRAAASRATLPQREAGGVGK
jgi:hypothetical protein